MAFEVEFKGILLDQKKGTFVSDNGREIDYHNARFFDQENNAIYKVKVPEDSVLPEPATPSLVVLTIELSEKYCSAYYGYCAGVK